MKSKCCGERIRKDSIGLILEKGVYVERGVCPECLSFCRVEVGSPNKFFHAAHQLLMNIKKGMIIIIDIVILLPCFLIVLIATHVIRISDKITLIPILRIRDDHEEMR